MESQNEKSSRAEKALIRVGTIATALVGLVTAVNAGLKDRAFLSPDAGQIAFSALNLITLLIFCLTAKATRQEFLDDYKSKRDYRALLRYTSDDDQSSRPFDAGKELERVNILAKQLHTNILWYAYLLIIVYVVYLLDNELVFAKLLGGKDYYRYVHLYFGVATGVFNYLSAVFLFLGFKVLYAKTVSTDGTNTPEDYYSTVAIISGIFLVVYIAFSVTIITVSLKNNNRPTSTLVSEIRDTISSYEREHGAPRTRFVVEVGGIVEASKQGSKSEQGALDDIKTALGRYEAGTDKPASELLDKIKNRIDVHNKEAVGDPSDFKVVLMKLFQLFIGIFNGLAMALLFGRYVSMEHAIYNMREGVYDSEQHIERIHIATIYILPIYALAQPLFGSFDVKVFGDPQIFANGVFFVCWVGKMFFLYLTYLFMKKRLVHLYLHAVISSHGIPPQLAKCFKPEF